MPTRHTTEPVYHPIRTLNLVVSTLTLLLTIDASVFSWQSWQEEKADLIRNLRNIMALEEKAIDAYFTQIERDILALGPDIIGTDDQINIEHALTLVKRFRESHPDMRQMHQMFTNLVTNAWESISDSKGTISISVKTVPAADISLSHRFPINWCPNENLYACLEVVDTGSGIKNADIYSERA